MSAPYIPPGQKKTPSDLAIIGFVAGAVMTAAAGFIIVALYMMAEALGWYLVAGASTLIAGGCIGSYLLTKDTE